MISDLAGGTDWKATWAGVSAIVATLALVAAAVVGLVAFFNLRHTREGKRAQILLTMHDRYHRAALQTFRRRLLIGDLASADLNNLEDVDTDLLAQLLNEMQMCAIYVELGLLTLRDVRMLFDLSPAAVWTKTSAYVQMRRVEGRPTYLRTLQSAFQLKAPAGDDGNVESVEY